MEKAVFVILVVAYTTCVTAHSPLIPHTPSPTTTTTTRKMPLDILACGDHSCSNDGDCDAGEVCTITDCKRHDDCLTGFDSSCCPVRCAYIVENDEPKNCVEDSDCPSDYHCVAYEYVDGKVCCPDEYIESIESGITTPHPDDGTTSTCWACRSTSVADDLPCDGSFCFDKSDCESNEVCTDEDCILHDECNTGQLTVCCPLRCEYVVENDEPKHCVDSSDCPRGFNCVSYLYVSENVCCPRSYVRKVLPPPMPESDVRKTFGCAGDGNCRCFEQTCYERDQEYCKCKNCDENKCCCETKAKSSSCDDSTCKCMGKKKSCMERGLRYCSPESCGGNCPGFRCCCKGSTIFTSVGYHEKCAAGKNCFCSKKRTCYEKRLAYCQCDPGMNCPDEKCCCSKAKVKTCSAKAKDCKCKRKPCHMIGFLYCKPGSCNGCADHLCCC